MAKKDKDKKELSRRVRVWRRIKLPVVILAGVIILFLFIFGVYSVSFAKKSYRNIFIGDLNLGGKNKDQISEILKPKTEEFVSSDFMLKYNAKEGEAREFVIKTDDVGLNYDVTKTAEEVYAVGRQGGAWRSFYQQFKTLFLPYKVDAVYTVNNEALKKQLAEIALEIDQPEKDYSLVYRGDGIFELSTERQDGRRIDQEKLLEIIDLQTKVIKKKEIIFESQVFQPQITEENAQIGLEQANKILAAGDIELTFAEKSFTLDVDTIAGLIGSRPKKDQMEIFVIKERSDKQSKAIADSIDRPAGDAVLSVSGGKVVVSSESQAGRELDQAQTSIDIENTIIARILAETSKVDSKKIELKVNLIQPEIDSAKLAEYGLLELVSTGTTSFYGSPGNRVHNISVGAKAINGALIKPGEEFSTLKRLGKIDASTGYLPELVIKNNKTVPDYGGGLCQVSTTLFRSALNAGMEILERRNHSYRVSYYEPPIGMDATIFDPAPDFRFKNNYSSYIFVQSKIVGTKITFEFYGTKDSRQIEIGQAVGFDYVEPPAPVETPDDSLQPGERKQVQKSHQGASAKFHYKVTRDGKTLQETDFLSKYVALPEIWLVGPAPAPAPEVTPDPSATPPVTEPAPAA
jgi:vancomycin resistance protein YoaR